MHVLAIDPGYANDPSGWLLAEVGVPRVTIRGGQVIDSRTEEPVRLPEGVTPVEYCRPRYTIMEARSERGLTEPQLAREALAVMRDIGDLVVVCDATGIGHGAAQQLRSKGLPTWAVTFTAGSKVTSGDGRFDLNVATSVMWQQAYAVLAEDRATVPDRLPGRDRLLEELRSVERQVGESGNETYLLPREGGSHADVAVCFGLTCVVGERTNARTVLRAERLTMRQASAKEVHQRPRSNRKPKQMVVYGGTGLPTPHGGHAGRLMRERDRFGGC